MQIENGLLFVSAHQLSGDPRFYEVNSINACVPIRNISHMKEHPHRGKVYTVLHLTNGDEIIADSTIPELIQLITKARSLSLFGVPGLNYSPNSEMVINGKDLKVMLERQASGNEAPSSFVKGGIIPADQAYKRWRSPLARTRDEADKKAISSVLGV